MPWGDRTGPWWKNSGADRAYWHGCCGRGMRMGRGYAARQAFMPVYYGIPRQPTPAEETSYLEETAKRLEEELRSVKERIEKLRSVA
jgi:hypothetical protein